MRYALLLLVSLVLLLSGCSTINLGQYFTPPDNDVYNYWRSTDKDFYCPSDGIKGMYSGYSSMTKDRFESKQIHLYRCRNLHKWVVIEYKDGTVKSMIIE